MDQNYHLISSMHPFAARFMVKREKSDKVKERKKEKKEIIDENTFLFKFNYVKTHHHFC